MSYCDRNCQRKHWKDHQRECVALEAPLPLTAQKAQNIAASQSLIPASAPRSDDDDQKENFFLASTALCKALAGKQEKWAEKHSIREHLRTQAWPDLAQNCKKLKYTLKPYLDAFFAKRVKLNALDLGAGNCSNVAVLIDVGFVHITAVDYMVGFEDLSKKKVHALKADNDLLQVALLEKDITPDDPEIFPRDESLGAIIARNIFEFCPPDDFENLLIASYASLEEGGCLIVSVILLDPTKPDHPYWKGGGWGFTSPNEVEAAENFLKSLGFGVKRMNIDYGPNQPEVLFFCYKC